MPHLSAFVGFFSGGAQAMASVDCVCPDVFETPPAIPIRPPLKPSPVALLVVDVFCVPL